MKIQPIGDGWHRIWCLGCDEAHGLPSSWAFNGNLEKPTFTPSFKISGKKLVWNEETKEREWVMDAEGKAVDFVCHFILTDGILNYCGDCTHSLSGKSVPLSDFPDDF